MTSAVRHAIVPLRAALAVLFAVLVILQTLSLPGQFRHMAVESPDLAYLRWPLTAVSVFWVLCAQVIVVCTWKLLTLVVEDRLFTDEAFGWVDGIVAAFVGGWVALVAVGAYVSLFLADDPSTPLVLLLLSTVVTIGGLLMLVMRSLLRQATALRSDLESVI